MNNRNLQSELDRYYSISCVLRIQRKQSFCFYFQYCLLIQTIHELIKNAMEAKVAQWGSV